MRFPTVKTWPTRPAHCVELWCGARRDSGRVQARRGPASTRTNGVTVWPTVPTLATRSIVTMANQCHQPINQQIKTTNETELQQTLPRRQRRGRLYTRTSTTYIHVLGRVTDNILTNLEFVTITLSENVLESQTRNLRDFEYGVHSQSQKVL